MPRTKKFKYIKYNHANENWDNYISLRIKLWRNFASLCFTTQIEHLGHDVEFIDYRPKVNRTFHDYIAKSPYRMIQKWMIFITSINTTKLIILEK